MLIVLEGPDGAGKSTLAMKLAEKYESAGAKLGLGPGKRETRFRHIGPPRDRLPGETAGQYAQSVYDRLLDEFSAYSPVEPGGLWVFDRLHWGAVVYGTLFRPGNDTDGYGDLTHGFFAGLEAELVARGAVTALLLPPVADLVRRSAEREDAFLDGVGLPSGPVPPAHGDSKRTAQLVAIHGAYADLVARKLPETNSWAGVAYYSSPAGSEGDPPESRWDVDRVALDLLQRAVDARRAARLPAAAEDTEREVRRVSAELGAAPL